MVLVNANKSAVMLLQFLLAFTNTTKSLRHRNGLVVLVNANKSAMLRIYGWPGKPYFWLYLIYPTHTPPHPNRLCSLFANNALQSITSKLAYIMVAHGMKPMAGN